MKASNQYSSISEANVAGLAKSGKQPRYPDRRVVQESTMFDSRLERDRWNELEMLERAGAISDLELKPHLKLSEAEIGYTPDYGYMQDGRQVYEDAKGVETERFRIIKRLWRPYGYGLLRITKRKDRKGKILTV